MLTQIFEFAVNNLYLVIAFVVLLGLVFFNEIKIATQRFATLSPAAAVQLMNSEDVVLLDVREAAETAGGKIAKAIQMPVAAVKTRIGELEKHKDKTLLVYCKTGARSACRLQGAEQKRFRQGFQFKRRPDGLAGSSFTP